MERYVGGQAVMAAASECHFSVVGLDISCGRS